MQSAVSTGYDRISQLDIVSSPVSHTTNMHVGNDNLTAPKKVAKENSSSTKKVRRVRKKYADDERPFVCEFCQRSYAFELSRDQHIRLKHVKGMPRVRLPSNSVLITGWRAIPNPHTKMNETQMSVLESQWSQQALDVGNVAAKGTIAPVPGVEKHNKTGNGRAHVRNTTSAPVGQIATPGHMSTPQGPAGRIADDRRIKSTTTSNSGINTQHHANHANQQINVYHKPNIDVNSSKQQVGLGNPVLHSKDGGRGKPPNLNTQCIKQSEPIGAVRNTRKDIGIHNMVFSSIDTDFKQNIDIHKYTKGIGGLANPDQGQNDRISEGNEHDMTPNSGRNPRGIKKVCLTTNDAICKPQSYLDSNEPSGEYNCESVNAIHGRSAAPLEVKTQHFHRNRHLKHPKCNRSVDAMAVASVTDLELLLSAVAESGPIREIAAEAEESVLSEHQGLVSLSQHSDHNRSTTNNDSGTSLAVTDHYTHSSWSHGGTHQYSSGRTSSARSLHGSGRGHRPGTRSSQVPLGRTDHCTGNPYTATESSADIYAAPKENDSDIFNAFLKDLMTNGVPRVPETEAVRMQRSTNRRSGSKHTESKNRVTSAPDGKIFTPIFTPRQVHEAQGHSQARSETWHNLRPQTHRWARPEGATNFGSSMDNNPGTRPNFTSTSHSTSNSGSRSSTQASHLRRPCHFHTFSSGDSSDAYSGSVKSSIDTFQSRSDTGSSD